jgi:hypothetical protein
MKLGLRSYQGMDDGFGSGNPAQPPWQDRSIKTRSKPEKQILRNSQDQYT